MLKIAVCAKQVPDTDIPPSQFKVDEGELRVIPPAGVPPIVNGFDMNAVEAALRLRDAGVECEIVIFSVGTEFALDVMKKPLAIGADRLVLVDDEASESLDALGTAQVLAAAIETRRRCRSGASRQAGLRLGSGACSDHVERADVRSTGHFGTKSCDEYCCWRIL